MMHEPPMDDLERSEHFQRERMLTRSRAKAEAEAEYYRARLVKLADVLRDAVETLSRNDPHDTVSDAGHTVLDGVLHEMRAALNERREE